MTTNQTAPVTDEELDQMILKLERDGMTPKMLSLMKEVREVRRAKMVVQPVMFIDGDISASDADKLASIIREWDDAPVPDATDEREAFNAWNNDIDCPLAGLTAKQAAWLAWLKRSGTIKTFDAISPPFKVHDEFDVWAKAEGLIHDSYGLRTINSSADVARKAWNACRAAMQSDGALTNEGTIPATQIKPVADLYGISVPGGRTTTYSTDAAEASDCRVMGWSVQEYVKLERYQAAMLQGADQAPVKQPSSNSVLGWLRADYQDDNRGLRGNAPLFVLGKKDPSTVWGLDYIPLASNSPVIPG